jgi:type I restriction enzyme S subunit
VSRFGDLIAELCPNGVEHRSLGDVATTVSGLSGKAKSDFTDGNSRFVSYKNAFANLAVNQHAADFVKMAEGERQNRLRVGDIVFTGSSESVEDVGMSSVVMTEPSEPLYLNSFCFAVRFNDGGFVDPGFSKYLFRSDGVRKQIRQSASGVTRINISKARFMKIQIPVPPPEVQREIIRILDQFTELEAALDAELEARKRQYDHYLQLLTSPFTVNGDLKDGWVRARVGDVAKIEKGRTPIQKASAGEYPLVATSRERQSSDQFDFDAKAVCVPLISSKGHGVASISRLYFQSGKFALGTILAAIIPTDTDVLSAEFLFYYLEARKNWLLVPLMRGGANVSLTVGSLRSVIIYLPPIGDQLRIVGALGSLNALTGDEHAGLPAELAARRKQHAYYRDKLLTFEEAA